LKILLGAFGDPGHAFPMLALGEALVARGHDVALQTWRRWEEAAQAAGMTFAAAPEYQVFPTRRRPLKPYEAAVRAAAETRPVVRAFAPDVVVSDILTPAPALAAELLGVRRATLVPHVYPVHADGIPFYGFGALPPRTAAGRALWRAGLPILEGGLRRGRSELNRTRAELGLPLDREYHGGISRELALVATFPQLEYPRRWPRHVHITGAMVFETPYPDVELPPGEAPLIVVAPSTAKDRDARLVRASLEGLAGEPVRVLASTNRVVAAAQLDVPANARAVEWVSYSQVMPRAALVICHGGHGTVMRALQAGAPVLACGSAGDMGENGARVAAAGAGLAVPRSLAGPRAIRWAARRILADGAFADRARAIAAWAARHDGAARGAELVENAAAVGR
jgi:UDP:flavonoid glycosyltransferase YjiC (YdhE family)